MLGIYILDHAVAPKFMRSSVTTGGYFRFLPQYFPCAQPTPPARGGDAQGEPPLHPTNPWNGWLGAQELAPVRWGVTQRQRSPLKPRAPRAPP